MYADEDGVLADLILEHGGRLRVQDEARRKTITAHTAKETNDLSLFLIVGIDLANLPDADDVLHHVVTTREVLWVGRHVTEVRLNHSRVTDAGLACLEVFPKLNKVNVKGCPLVTPDGLREVAALPYVTKVIPPDAASQGISCSSAVIRNPIKKITDEATRRDKAASATGSSEAIEHTFRVGLEDLELRLYWHALAAFDLALRRKPRDFLITGCAATALIGARQYAEGMKVYRDALLLMPDDTDALQDRPGWSYRFPHSKAVARGVPRLRDATRLKPNDFMSHFSLGLACERAGRYEEAIVALQKATRLKEDDYLSYRLLGLSYEGIYRRSAAAKAFRKALSLNPNDSRSRVHLELCE